MRRKKHINDISPGKRLFITIILILTAMLLFSCKSRKLAIDQSKTVDHSQINQSSATKESLQTTKTDNTVTKTTVDSTAGTKVTEEYSFVPDTSKSLKPAENAPTGSLPMNRLNGYKKTTETFGKKRTEKQENKNTGESTNLLKDSTGSTQTKKDLTTSDKKKTLDAKQGGFGWIWGLFACLVAVGACIFIVKKK